MSSLSSPHLGFELGVQLTHNDHLLMNSEVSLTNRNLMTQKAANMEPQPPPPSHDMGPSMSTLMRVLHASNQLVCAFLTYVHISPRQFSHAHFLFVQVLYMISGPEYNNYNNKTSQRECFE